MHFDKIKRTWQRVQSKMKALLESFENDRPGNAQPVNVMIGIAMLTMLASQGIAEAKNAAQQDRQDAKRAEKSANQNGREVKQENRKEARDDRADNRESNRQDNRQSHAQNRATQQAEFRAETDAAQARSDSKLQQRADNANSRAAQERADENANNRATERRAEEHAQNRAAQNQANDRAQEQAAQNRANNRAEIRADNQAHDRAVNDRKDERRDNHEARVESRYIWDNGLNNRQRYQAYTKYRNNWSDQRTYLNANLRRFNQLAALNQQQQQQLDNQMREAYLSYHHNNWNGAYNWDGYSDPQFLDYLQSSKPSLLQTILGYLGLGGNGNYLYSSDWNDERSQLARNMADIHQLALEGRITPSQEQTLLDQMRPEFMAYHHNNWNGNATWTQYSDPGFVDYLNQRQPSILTTVRDYLIR